MGTHVVALSASSWTAGVSSLVAQGWYLPSRMRMKSLMGPPKTIMTGDSLLDGSGVFLY